MSQFIKLNWLPQMLCVCYMRISISNLCDSENCGLEAQYGMEKLWSGSPSREVTPGRPPGGAAGGLDKGGPLA